MNNKAIIPKNKCGTEGSKEYLNACAIATTALCPKLGAAKHFITGMDPGNVNYLNVQEQFV